MAVGSDDERSHGGRHVPNHAPTVASSVLNQDIAGSQRHLRAIVELECQVAGENDPEIRRVGPVKAGVSSTKFVAILEVHLGSGFWSMKSPGKYVPMTKRMPPKGGNIPGAAGLFPAFG